MDDFIDYYQKLQDKISEKEINNFWVICDRIDFKPIKNISKVDIQKYILGKVQYYREKTLANVKFIFESDTKLKKHINSKTGLLDDSALVLTIKIYIYCINNDGKIDYDDSNTWSLVISWTKDELNNNHFTIDELKKMIDTAYLRKIMSDMAGISYTSWLNRFNKLNKKKSKRSKSKQSKSKQSKSKRSKSKRSK